MWPLYVSQLADAIAPAAVPTGALPEELGRRVLYRAIAWRLGGLDARDVFFAVTDELHALVPGALSSEAVCVVDRRWAGLSVLPEEQRVRCFLAEHPLAAFRLLAAFMRSRITFPVVAVGGSNGKTTTKDMLATVLGAGGRRVTVTPGTNNGWVGLPITLCQPAHTDPAPDALVLEIGIDEKGAMAEHVKLAQPDIGVLTALGPEHLAGLGTHEDAIREELVLFAGSKRRVWLAEDPALAVRLGEARAGDLVVHDIETPAPATDADLLAYTWTATSPRGGALSVTWRGETRQSRVPVPGAHNGRNAALAIGVAVLLGRTLVEATRALEELRGPEQRCVVRELPSGCVLVDDTYNASPSSIEAALEVIDGFDPTRERVLLLGDMLDLGEQSAHWHEAIAPKLAAKKGAHVRLYGEHMSALAPRLSGAASVGRALASEDPSVLLDLGALERCVVLVKGSRGMALERAVAHITASEARAWDEDAIGIGVSGADAREVATALRSIEWAAGSRRVFVRALDVTELQGGEAQRRPYHVAVLTRFEPEADPESELAAIAQLFVHLRAGGVAVLPAADDQDEVVALLADVIPPGVEILKLAAEQRLSVVISRAIARRQVVAEKASGPIASND